MGGEIGGFAVGPEEVDGNIVGDGKLVHKNCSISPITLEIITNSSLLLS